jgi:hypothetical protein
MAPESESSICLERINLLEEQAPPWLYESLNFRSGFTLALLALVFWTNSVTSIYSLSQNTKVEISEITLENRSITLQLDVYDTPSNLRHFHPMLLALASDNRNYLAQYPSRITLNKEVYTPSQTIYSYDIRSIQDGVLHVAIHFDVDKDLKGISKLKDVYLWYATTKIVRVKTDEQSEADLTEIPGIKVPGYKLSPDNSNEDTKAPYVDVKNSSPLRIPLNRPRRLWSSRT